MDFLGIWTNQLGSTLEISSIDAKGLIKGNYRTAVGHPDPNEQHDLTGYTKDKLISFVVSYEEWNCICSWTGRLEDDGRLHTLWQYVSTETYDENKTTGQAEKRPTKLWEAFHVQTDVFERKS